MSDRDIIDCVRQMAGTYSEDKVGLVAASVDAVNMAARTCDVTTISGKESTAILGVKLMASVDDGILFVPTIGSTIFVCYSNYNVPYVTLFSQLDQVFFIATTSIQFNGGELGGLVRVADLIAKLNNIENAFNLLNTKVNTLAATPVIPPLVVSQRSDIENTSIKHGS